MFGAVRFRDATGVTCFDTGRAEAGRSVQSRLLSFSPEFTTSQTGSFLRYESNILAHELLYRSAVVGDVISYVVFIPYRLIIYNLFRPVSTRLSLLAAVLNLVALAIQFSICVLLLAPLAVLQGAQSLSAVNVDQSQALALMFLNFYDAGYTVSMVLCGFYDLLIGYLIFRSTFLPRILGVLLAIAGFYYQINNFAALPFPAIAARVEPYVFVIGMAELLLALWLVVMGVNEQRWKEQASAAVE